MQKRKIDDICFTRTQYLVVDGVQRTLGPAPRGFSEHDGAGPRVVSGVNLHKAEHSDDPWSCVRIDLISALRCELGLWCKPGLSRNRSMFVLSIRSNSGYAASAAR